MKKLFYLFLSLCVLVSLFTVSTLAAEDASYEANGGYADTATVANGDTAAEGTNTTLTAEGEATNNTQDGSDTTDGSEAESDSEDEGGTQGGNNADDGAEVGGENTDLGDTGSTDVDTNENFFAVIYDELALHADKILSALAFVGSLIIAFAYKKGLIPVIQNALANMGARVGELRDSTEKSISVANGSIEAVTEKLAGAEALIGELSEKLSALERELNDCAVDRENRRAFNLILTTQIDMLYDVFMSSSLPLYQKEQISEKISEMKKAIAAEKSEG